MELLRTYCHNNQCDWANYLPSVEYGQNSLQHSAMTLTPFQCVMGYKPLLIPWNANPTGVPGLMASMGKHSSKTKECSRDLKALCWPSLAYMDPQQQKAQYMVHPFHLIKKNNPNYIQVRITSSLQGKLFLLCVLIETCSSRSPEKGQCLTWLHRLCFCLTLFGLYKLIGFTWTVFGHQVYFPFFYVYN